MGFIYAVALLASFCFVALPGGALALVLGGRADRTATFWLAASGAAAVALAVRVFLVLRPHLPTGKLPVWSGRFALILSASLLVTGLLCAASLLAVRLRGSPRACARCTLEPVFGREPPMADFLLIESRDPFDSNDVATFYDLAGDLVREGQEVVLFLVENGVLPARVSARADGLAAVAAAGVRVLADEFSLRERGIARDRLVGGVSAAPLDVVIDELAGGARAIWH